MPVSGGPSARLSGCTPPGRPGRMMSVTGEPARRAGERALRHVAARSAGAPLGPRLRVTLNFHPDRDAGGGPILDRLGADGTYRSQFVTGTSNGGLTAFPGGDRWRWESRIFGGAYDQAPAADRPVYGALNFRSRSARPRSTGRSSSARTSRRWSWTRATGAPPSRPRRAGWAARSSGTAASGSRWRNCGATPATGGRSTSGWPRGSRSTAPWTRGSSARRRGRAAMTSRP
jgi:hypothetical protein